jgi:ABC-2 type transport system ATP-binding protein
MDEAAQCDRLGILRRGSLDAVGSPTELKQKAVRGDIVDLLCSNVQAAKQIIEALDCVSSVEKRDGWLRIVVGEAASAIPRIISRLEKAGVTVDHVRVSEVTLEDVFLSLAARGENS